MKTSTLEEQSASSLQLSKRPQRYVIVRTNIPRYRQILGISSSSDSAAQGLCCTYSHAPSWSFSLREDVEMSVWPWLQESQSPVSSTQSYFHWFRSVLDKSPSLWACLPLCPILWFNSLSSFHGLLPLKVLQLSMWVGQEADPWLRWSKEARLW